MKKDKTEKKLGKVKEDKDSIKKKSEIKTADDEDELMVEIKEKKTKNSKKDKSKDAKEETKEEPKEKTLDEKYIDALDEIKSLKEKQMYLQAEMENSRKIMLKRIDIEKYNVRVNTIKYFLPVVESINAAISKLEKDPALKSDNENSNGNGKYLEGFKVVQNQYMQILKGTGVKPILEVNVPFNYKKHEVMMKFEDDSKPEDTVIQIIQTGWNIDDNVLRPAKVIVSKKKEVPKPIAVIKLDEEVDVKKETEKEVANGAVNVEKTEAVDGKETIDKISAVEKP